MTANRHYRFLKRALDITAVAVCLPAIFPLCGIIAAMVRITSPGPALYWSERIGAGGGTFQMPKFRTMRVGTPAVATHLLADPSSVLTPIGGFLRRSSLDELPQLWAVLKGEMSLVGPRPALFNQDDLIALRTATGVLGLVPGITGWAQINGRDDLLIAEKVEMEAQYLRQRSFAFDAKILVFTLFRVASSEGVQH